MQSVRFACLTCGCYAHLLWPSLSRATSPPYIHIPFWTLSTIHGRLRTSAFHFILFVCEYKKHDVCYNWKQWYDKQHIFNTIYNSEYIRTYEMQCECVCVSTTHTNAYTWFEIIIINIWSAIRVVSSPLQSRHHVTFLLLLLITTHIHIEDRIIVIHFIFFIFASCAL